MSLSMSRKIIRISVIVAEDGDEHPYVLCDDGTTWYLELGKAGMGDAMRWVMLPPIPQHDEEQKEGS